MGKQRYTNQICAMLEAKWGTCEINVLSVHRQCNVHLCIYKQSNCVCDVLVSVSCTFFTNATVSAGLPL